MLYNLTTRTEGTSYWFEGLRIPIAPFWLPRGEVSAVGVDPTYIFIATEASDNYDPTMSR